jgi:fucose 4-O-acetylase-like acetyltransferase
MTDKQINRFTGVSGIICFLLYICVAVLLIDSPGIDASNQDVLAFLKNNRPAVLVSIYLWGLCISMTYCFLTGYWAVSRKAEKEPGILSTLGLGSGFVIFVVALCGFIFALGGAFLSNSIDAATAGLLNSLTILSVALTGFPTVVSMVSFSAVIIRTGFLPVWLGKSGLFVALLHLISGGAFAASGLLSPSGIGIYVAPVFYYLWILITSIFILKKQ